MSLAHPATRARLQTLGRGPLEEAVGVAEPADPIPTESRIDLYSGGVSRLPRGAAHRSPGLRMEWAAADVPVASLGRV